MVLSVPNQREAKKLWHKLKHFINFVPWRAEEETGSAEEQPASNKLSAPHWTYSDAGGAAVMEAPLSACLGGATWLRKPNHSKSSKRKGNVNNMLKIFLIYYSS